MNKGCLLAGVIVGFAAPSALAADIVEPAVYDWTGPYIGLNAGYGWGKTKAYDDDHGNGGFWDHSGGKFDADVDGFVGGAQIGANYQIDQFVLGIEGDFGWLGVTGQGRYEDGIPTTKVETDGGLFGTIRGRLGFAFDRFMIFGTGGAIIADLDSKVHDDDNDPILRDIDAETRVGWTAGGGVEYALDDNWSLKVEYLYYDLGKVRNEAKFGDNPGPDDIQSFQIKNTGNIIRAGVNWHF